MRGLDVSNASAGEAVRAVLKPAPPSKPIKTGIYRFHIACQQLAAWDLLGSLDRLPDRLPNSSSTRAPPRLRLVDAKAAPARSAPSRPGGRRLRMRRASAAGRSRSHEWPNPARIWQARRAPRRLS